MSTDFDEDPDRRSMYELVLDVLRWERRNKATNQSVDELLALLRPFFRERDGSKPFPKTYLEALSIMNEFNVLKIHKREMCTNGCYRFEEDTQEVECPTCLMPRRTPEGKRTTCTFSHFDLKDKLRLLYARPSFVESLTSHSNTKPHPKGFTSGVHGTYS